MEFLEYKRQVSQHWHRRLLFLYWALWLIVLLLELGLAFIFCNLLPGYQHHPGSYFAKRVLLPSGINFASVLTYTIIYKNTKKRIRFENWASTLSITIISISIATFHNYFQALLFLPCLPIFVSAIFSDPALTNTTAIISGLSSSIIFHFWSQHVEKKTWFLVFLPTFIVWLAVLIISYIFVKLIMQAQSEQSDFIYEAYSTQEELISELNIDPMTGLSNRRAMDKALSLYIQKFNEEDFTPRLAIMDIDHFKTVNDTYGHNAGDIAIKGLASIIKKHMGGIRRAFRFGGDEMVLLFNRESKEEINKIIESIREDFRTTEFPFKPKSPLTISVGVSSLQKGQSKKAWFEITDKTMYKSKQNGRDQITYND